MKVFPLVRPKLSNEHIMTFVFMILIMYQLPQWLEKPLYILSFLGVLACGLLLDTILSTKRSKTIKCSVSAAVTVGVIYALFPDIHFFGGLLGVVVSLLLGKHLFGGTGHNILNPAMVGVVLLQIIFPTDGVLFSNNYIIIIAMFLSLPFLLIRPYASLGLMIGMFIALSLNNSLSLENVIFSGVLFWGCMVITDPVTITYRPSVGALGGASVGFVAIFFDSFTTAGSIAILVLGLNVISTLVDNYMPKNSKEKLKRTKVKVPYSNIIKHSEHLNSDQKNRLMIDSNNKLTKDDILDKIEACEVVGLGGAGFATHLKIKSVIQSRVKGKHLIVNAVECDPGLVHDAWILREYPEEISLGIRLICECIPHCKVVLASKDISNLKFEENINVIKVPNYYPIGAEKKLIKHILNIDLPNDCIPAQEGILVLNIQTIFSICEAVYLNKKANTKFVTVANLALKEAQIIKVKIGNRVSEVVDTIYGSEEPVFIGGGLMQARLVNEDELIEKTTNFIAISPFPRYKESYCSKCGICVNRCPSGLQVYKIANYVDKENLEKTIPYNPQKCISCGLCSYCCLAGRNLSRKVKMAKEFCLMN